MVATVLAFVTFSTIGADSALAQSEEKALKPGGHLKIENPNKLSHAEARKVYDSIADELAEAYGLSREPSAMAFRKWKIYNSAPYLSATHGNRYVNNYANARAVGYGSLKPGEKLPVGSILAKDSFTVTADGEVFGAALFVMEKLAAGKSPATGDWRYVMILPDGSYFGDTEGDNAADVAYCHTCHKVKKRNDFIFYVPKAYRR
jgi:hypothetical protein